MDKEILKGLSNQEIADRFNEYEAFLYEQEQE